MYTVFMCECVCVLSLSDGDLYFRHQTEESRIAKASGVFSIAVQFKFKAVKTWFYRWIIVETWI